MIAPSLDRFVSKPALEEIRRAWLVAAGDTSLLSRIGTVGAWWGLVPKPLPAISRNLSEGEIDVIATQGNQVVLAGEAKWSREPVSFGVFNHLRETVAHVPGAHEQTQLALFGRTFGFNLQTAAAAEGVKLVTVDDLYSL